MPSACARNVLAMMLAVRHGGTSGPDAPVDIHALVACDQGVGRKRLHQVRDRVRRF